MLFDRGDKAADHKAVGLHRVLVLYHSFAMKSALVFLKSLHFWSVACFINLFWMRFR